MDRIRSHAPFRCQEILDGKFAVHFRSRPDTQRLDRIGYADFRAYDLFASDFGVPQARGGARSTDDGGGVDNRSARGRESGLETPG